MPYCREGSMFIGPSLIAAFYAEEIALANNIYYYYYYL